MENIHLFIILFLVGIIIGGVVILNVTHRYPYSTAPAIHTTDMGYHRNETSRWVMTLVFVILLFLFFASQHSTTNTSGTMHNISVPRIEAR